jgi:hypothetical protein
VLHCRAGFGPLDGRIAVFPVRNRGGAPLRLDEAERKRGVPISEIIMESNTSIVSEGWSASPSGAVRS